MCSGKPCCKRGRWIWYTLVCKVSSCQKAPAAAQREHSPGSPAESWPQPAGLLCFIPCRLHVVFAVSSMLVLLLVVCVVTVLYNLQAVPMPVIPYHTIPYHTIPYHTIPHHTIPYHPIPYHTIPYHAIPCRSMPCNAMLCTCCNSFCKTSAMLQHVPPMQEVQLMRGTTNVSANDVVNGSREATLGLLWRVFIHFQVYIH